MGMAERIMISFGAGLASALLAAAMAHGEFATAGLALLAPIPIMIAVLGWGLVEGAAAVVVAAVVTFVLVGVDDVIELALTLLLPALALGALAAFPAPAWAWRAAPSASPRYVPLGVLGLASVAVAILVNWTTLTWVAIAKGGLQAGIDAVVASFEAKILATPGFDADDLGATSLHDTVESVVRIAPGFVGALLTVTLLVDLYLAARAVASSGRLKRPWVDVRDSFALPRWAGALFMVALALAIVMPEPQDEFAWTAVGALGCAYMLQGLAVLHALTRGLSQRAFALVGLYVALAITLRTTYLIFPLILIALIATIGLVESFVALRARAARASHQPPRRS